MRLRYYILAIFPIILVIGCSPTRRLKENEPLLWKQKIDIEKEKKEKKVSREEITELYQQTANRKILFYFTPSISIYNFGKKFYDTSKVIMEIGKVRTEFDTMISQTNDSSKVAKLIAKKEKKLKKLNTKLKEGNWFMRGPGAAPVIYDSTLNRKTLEQIQYYLLSKGYFHSKVSNTVKIGRKKVKEEYILYQGPPHLITDVHFESEDIPDPKIREIILNDKTESVLKVNDNYDAEKISEERERITKLLKNNGYFDFNRQYIFFQVDTTQKDESVVIYTIIKNPSENSLHKQYRIKEIFFNTDVTAIPGKTRDTTFYEGTNFIFYRKNFSKKLLDNRIKLNPDSLYRFKNLQETQIQLAGLDMYKFVNIIPSKTDSVSNSLSVLINTSPLKKHQISDEWGMNVSQGFIPGPYASLTFKDRNVFNGFEIFEASVRYSLEAVLNQNAQPGDDNNTIIMKEYGGTSSLTFPQIFFPSLGKKAKYYNPKTKVSLGYNFINRPEYIRSNLRTTLNYTWQRTINRNYNISLIDIGIVKTPFINDRFYERLLQLKSLGNNLITSFSNSIITSFNAYYIFNNNELGVVKRSKYFKPSFEFGGLVVNALSRYLTKEPKNEFLGLQYFEFFKLGADLRYYFPITKKNTFAMRFNGGYARPYGSSATDSFFVLPYEKYFFAGGSNSNRAWKPRRLGPGSYKDTVNNYLYEQQGHMILESSYEFRFDVVKYLDMAFFVDAGNIWTLNKDNSRPGSQFKFNSFLSQIAVGSGVGFRFDFTFLILRFDLGFKVWDPGERGPNRFTLLSNPRPVLNIGIGYPF